MIKVTREQARDMADAHAEGLHELPREGCPECEGRELRGYPGDTVPTISHVEIEVEGDGTVHVSPIWTGVDRPYVGGYTVKDERMAERLKRAMLAGAVYSDVRVHTDVNGKTYAHGSTAIRGRAMNADLKRLGY